MTSKEALEIFLKLVDPQDENEWENCQKAHIKLKQDLEMIDLLAECYYASSINKELYKTPYGFDNPQDVRKIGEWLDEK